MAKNFPCPGCNADLQWSPGQGDLTCPYCGHVHKDSSSAGLGFKPPTHFVSEVDSWRRDAPGWGEDKKELKCGSCGATSDVEPQIEATSCPFCGSTQLDMQQGGRYSDTLRPDAIAPFIVEKNEAIRKFRDWLAGLWFRPSGLKEMAGLGNLSGVYLPAWSLDAGTSTKWTAERGHHYYEEEKVTGSDGKTETRRVQKTRWENAKGTVNETFKDVMVIASKGLEQEHLAALEPFDMGKLGAYEARYLQGYVAERYQLGLDEGFDGAKKIMEERLKEIAGKMVGGDTHRNVEVEVKYFDARFKLLLIPIWIAAYQYGGKAYRFLVNGQTGKVTGTAPYSVAKIVLTILAVIAVIGTLVLLSR